LCVHVNSSMEKQLVQMLRVINTINLGHICMQVFISIHNMKFGIHYFPERKHSKLPTIRQLVE